MKAVCVVLCALVLACGASSSSPSDPPSGPTGPTGSTGPTGPTEPGQPSSGCGSWTLGRGASTGTIQVNGLDRTYALLVPAGTSGPVPVVFAFHGSGDTASNFRGWFGHGLESTAAGPTIFVYPEALPVGGTGARGWDDAGGRDTAFFDALLARVEAQACVATARVFVTGFSYGAFMSNSLGCKRAGTVRAIAPLSGGLPWGGSCNGQRVAAFLACGDTDTLLQGTTDALAHWVALDGCGSSKSAVSPSPCVAYSGCASGYPVVWCPFTGGHTVLSWEEPAVMRFFDALP